LKDNEAVGSYFLGISDILANDNEISSVVGRFMNDLHAHSVDRLCGILRSHFDYDLLHEIFGESKCVAIREDYLLVNETNKGGLADNIVHVNSDLFHFGV
jgi:hypothetical protein